MDKKQNKNIEPKAYKTLYAGDMIESQIVMEPGAQYDHDLGDFFTIQTKGVGVYGEGNTFHMTFSSFEQLEEFSDQITGYVDECRRQLESKGRIFNGTLCNTSCPRYAHGDCPYRYHERMQKCPRYAYRLSRLSDKDNPKS